jgi:sulfonate transport system substrate-binding protein
VTRLLPRRSALPALALASASVMLLAGCAAGEGSAVAPAAAEASADPAGWSADTLTVDWATYNPLSLIVKDQGLLEERLGSDVTVEWVQSAGSNKANELLRAGAVDVGSTAGSAALLARANGSPIRTIDVYSQPEWTAIVVPQGSPITSVDQLRGADIAATTGTDPYFFLLQTLDEAGIPASEVTIQNLQHADGRAALENGSVDAWAGLDPLMAASQAQAGSTLLYRNVDFATYGFLNATESFLDASPDLAQAVVDANEQARAWAVEHPDETAAILAQAAAIDPAVASTVIDRTDLGVDPVPGDAQRSVLERVGPILVDSKDVEDQGKVDAAIDELFEPRFAESADPAAGTAG